SEHRNPEKKRDASRRQGDQKLPAAPSGKQKRARPDENDPEVVSPQCERGQSRCGAEAPGRRFASKEQQEEREIQQREDSVCPRPSGIGEQKRARRRQRREPEIRSLSGKAQGQGEEAGDREERRDTGGDVGSRELPEPDERLFQDIEEGRPRIVAQRLQKRGQRQPRSPDREQLVVPKGANDQQRDARTDREEKRDEKRSEKPYGPIRRLIEDALSYLGVSPFT